MMRSILRAVVVFFAAVVMAVSALAATSAQAYTPGGPSDYIAVMYSWSLNKDFGGSSPDLALAKGLAYNQCLRYASAHHSDYKNDCNRGLWVRDGYIAVVTSRPYTRGVPYAWGFGWARTLERARALAVDYCRSYGGQQCQEKSWWSGVSDVNGPSAPTIGGDW